MDSVPPEAVPGFAVPVHRALTEHILLGGAPRGLAIANATLAGAVGLGLRLWIAGIVFFALGHMVAVARRHLRFPNYLQV
jgi:type IV secretory pathway TrbD component